MKNSFIRLIALLLLLGPVLSCSSYSGKKSDSPTDSNANPVTPISETDPENAPKITFEKDFHNFGKISQGEKVTYSFKFKNTGKSVLLISNVSSSCGCTVSDFPKEPVMPGKSGQIDVRFDSEGKRGQETKTVTVFANTQPNSTLLRIQAMIILPEDK